ncbi:MAG: calcium/sodium antiporter [Sulfurimonadaceae bacterium]|jgi:cation:H+ antiporter|nr:calcium/sodium antiporter [Sulfurimonadaceae bacterium]
MFLFTLAIITGFVLLVWSADKFVDGAAATAKHLGMPSLLVGVLIVGFGTSAPEMVVSAMAALDGKPALALGNAIGSNIVNISLILGVTALVAPIVVNSKIVRKELPLLIVITLLSGALLYDGSLGLYEGLLLLVGFFSVIGWSAYSALTSKGDTLEDDMDQELTPLMSLRAGITWLIVGLLVLVASSRLLVFGAVGIAESFGVSELIIGLTIVALGTSLPELAASVVAVKKGEHDIAIGNVVGSNMFNILAVIGIAAVIHPMTNLDPEVLYRDWSVMFALTIALFIMAYGIKSRGRIGRFEGALLLTSYVAYNSYLGYTLGAF